uniref:Interleukin-12 subunit alpha n=1 Tax=Oryzias melastigma TaxID=30732 RepID=A0A3B3CS03_ORYME
MDFCFTTIVVLLGLLSAASCAPIGAHDPCGAARSSSLELNHLAKIASEEVKKGSTDQANFSSKLAFMQASDMCDPESLKHKSMPCVGKIFSTLKSYSSAVKRISGFQSCMKSTEKVEMALQKLSIDMRQCVESLGGLNHNLNSIISEGDTEPIEHWKEPLLCSYTLDRLFSFSIFTARVFAAGDPAHHTTSSPQKCM